MTYSKSKRPTEEGNGGKDSLGGSKGVVYGRDPDRGKTRGLPRNAKHITPVQAYIQYTVYNPSQKEIRKAVPKLPVSHSHPVLSGRKMMFSSCDKVYNVCAITN